MHYIIYLYIMISSARVGVRPVIHKIDILS